MGNEIAIAVLGAGKMGFIHCESISATPGLRLAGASSGSAERLAEIQKRFAVDTYSSHDALLRAPEVRWVVISTTTEKHKEWALKALAAGKELIVEKPIALTYSDAKEIIEEGRRRNLRVTVFQNRRWDNDFRLVRKITRQSLLGEIYRIESRYASFSEGWGAWGAQGAANPWRLKKQYGGGLLNDWGPHLLDQIFLLTRSKVTSLFCRAYSKIWSTEVDDHFWIELIFANGQTARVEASNNARISQPRWYLWGTKGTLQVKGGNLTDWNAALIRKSSAGYSVETRITYDQRELSLGFYEAFADAVMNNKSLAVRPAQILRVMKTIDAARASSHRGRSVSFK
jgi:predicted dehydrogenase